MLEALGEPLYTSSCRPFCSCAATLSALGPVCKCSPYFPHSPTPFSSANLPRASCNVPNSLTPALNLGRLSGPLSKAADDSVDRFKEWLSASLGHATLSAVLLSARCQLPTPSVVPCPSCASSFPWRPCELASSRCVWVHLYLAFVLMLSLWHISSAPKVLTTASCVDDCPAYFSQGHLFPECRVHPLPTKRLCLGAPLVRHIWHSQLRKVTFSKWVYPSVFCSPASGTTVPAVIQGRHWEWKSRILPFLAASLTFPDSLVLSFPTACVVPRAMYAFCPCAHFPCVWHSGLTSFPLTVFSRLPS